MADSDTNEIPHAKRVVFYKSGNQQFPGLKVAVDRRETLQSLTSTVSQKTNLGVRSIYTPGAKTRVTSINDLNDGEFYLVSSVAKAVPVDLAQIPNRKIWDNIRGGNRSKRNASLSDRRRAHSPHPPSSDEGKQSKDPRRVHSHPKTVQLMPKRVVVFKNGDPHMKHMLLLNTHSKYEFDTLLMDISDMFKLRLCKLFTTEGFKIESLSAILNGPDLYVAAGSTEEFRRGNYIENSPLRNKQNRLRRKSEDNTDQPPPKMQKKTRGKWTVWVTTNDNPSAGTDAMVFLSVYGDKGKTDDLVLGCGDGYFEAGAENSFNVQLGNIGEIYKIRLGHDDNTEYAGWLCDKVEMEDSNTDEVLSFQCNRWMSREEEDGEICRELPVMKNNKPLYPVVVYKVSVVTGTLWNAGTSASVYLTIFGERGDTGARLLYAANEPKFQRGKTDTFTVEAVSLGKLEKIAIGHDLTTAGEGWFLDKVVITEDSDINQEITFSCNRWLDAGEDDRKTNRDLAADTKATTGLKTIWEQEKWKYEPGNELVFFSQASGGALCVHEDGELEANGDIKQDKQACVFSVEKGKAKYARKFTNLASPTCLAIDDNKVTAISVDEAGPQSELKIRIQPDRTIAMESVRFPSQMVTMLKSGKAGDSRGTKLGPMKTFHTYVKGMFRDRGIVLLYTSSTQAFMADLTGSCMAVGTPSEDAHWVVHRVSDGRIRMFESVAQPGCFLRFKEGTCDIMGSGSGKPCQFIINKFRDKGFVVLESCAKRDVFIGFLPDGTVDMTTDTEADNVRLYPAVIKFGIKKMQPNPPPLRKKRALKAQRAPRNNVSSLSVMDIVDESSGSEVETEPEGSDGEWQVMVKTGKVGTKSKVVLVVYGDEGVSEEITLGKGGDLFKAGEENEFKVNLAGIGTIYKIRIGLDSTSRKASWRLDQVKMKDLNTGEVLSFKFRNCWLSAKEADCDVWREMAAVRPGKKGLPVVTYQVQVVTGTEPGSGTDVRVYLAIHGEQGDTGKRALVKSDKEEKFQEGQIDTFEIQAVSVKKPKRIVVGHDGKGYGAGWFLKQVIVKDANEPMMEYVFECNKWLDEGEDDHLIERELELTEVRTVEQFDWKIYVTTGPLETAATKSKVSLWVYGELDKKQVDLVPEHGDGFKSGTMEDFKVNLGDIGPLFKIRIGHDNSVPDTGWYLKNLRMVDLFENQESSFDFDRWMSQQHDDKDIWRELPIQIPGKRTMPITRYYIQVFTGSVEGAETSSNVYMNIFGQKADTGRRELVYSKMNKESKFRSGQIDVFEIEAVYLGKLQKVIIGHDGKKAGEGWFLDKILVRDAHRAKNDVYFACNKWLDAGQGDKAIERELKASKPPAAPNKITDLSALSTVDAIKLMWEAPSGNATGYRVTCDPPDCSKSVVSVEDLKTTHAKFKGLKSGTEYKFAVTTVNVYAESEKVELKANTKPNKVLNPVTESTANAIVVNWNAPDGNFSGYRIRLVPPDAKKSKVDIKDVNKTRAEFTGLTPNKKYKVHVTTLSGQTESDKITVQDKTKPPEIQLLRVEDESFKSTAKTITVSWSRPEGDVTGYHVVLIPPEGDKQEQAIDSPDKTSAEFRGLKAGQEYTVEVTSMYKDQESNKAVLVARTESAVIKCPFFGNLQVQGKTQLFNLPEAGGESIPKVVDAKVDDTTVSSIVVSWAKPEDCKNIKGYRITCTSNKKDEGKEDVLNGGSEDKRDESASHQEIKLFGSDVTHVKINDLEESVSYALEVFAFGEDDESEGTTLRAVAKANGQGSLSQVGNVKVDDTTDTSIIISWAKPEDCNNITAYRVTCKLKKTDKEDASTGQEDQNNAINLPQEISIDGCDVTSATLSELHAGKTYIAEVFAICGDKEGEGTTVEADTRTEAEMKQNIPKVVDAKVEEVTDTTITVSWTKPDDCDIISAYRITCLFKGSKGSGDESEDDMTSTDATLNSKSQDDGNSPTVLYEIKLYGRDVTIGTFSGLQPETTYSLVVFTMCGDMESEGAVVEDTTKARTELDKVTNQTIPKVIDAKVDDTTTASITISWTKPEDCDNISAYRIMCQIRESEEDKDEASEKHRTDTSSSGHQDEEKAQTSLQEIQMDGSDVTHATFNELHAGKTYVLEVFTVCGNKESERTRLEATTKAEGEENIPKVVNAKIDNRTDSSISISWTTPEDCDGITLYRITLKGTACTDDNENEDSEEVEEYETEDETEDEEDKHEENMDRIEEDRLTLIQEMKVDGSGTMRATFSDLQFATVYVLEIFTVCGDKESDGTIVKATTRQEGEIPIPKVEDMKIEETTESYITVSWKKPQDCENITAYRIMCSSKDADNEQKEDDASGDQNMTATSLQEIRLYGCKVTRATFHELQAGQEYVLEVFTVCEQNESEGTALEATAKVGEGVVNVDSTTESAITISWTKPKDSDHITGHRVTCTILGSGAGEGADEIKLDGTDPTTATFSDLQSGVEYVLEVLNVTGQEEEPAHKVNARTKPSYSQVKEPKADSTEDTIDVSWSKPEGVATGYRITCTPADAANSEVKVEDPEMTLAKFEGLVAGKQYRIEIYSLNDGKEGQKVTLNKATKPKPVADGKCANSTSTSVTLTWTKPEGDLSGYKISYTPIKEGEKDENKEGEKDENLKSMTVNVDATEAKVAGLDGLQLYRFDIYTVSGEEESEAVSLQEKTKVDGEWKVWVTTHDDSTPANNSSVHLVVYGKDGKSEPIVLTDLDGAKKETDAEDKQKKNKKKKKDKKEKEATQEKKHNFFEPGKTDEFDVKFGSVGDVYKIRIGLEHGASWEGWHLKEVKMQDKSTDKELLFKFDRWMSRNQDDFDIVRELPVVIEDEEAIPVEVYHVTVLTGDHWAAHTDTTVWINIHGDQGDTGKRILYHSLTEGMMFMRDRPDLFKVEAVSLGELKMVEIGHDGIGYGAGIFVQSVVVKKSEPAEEEYYFQCNQWLDDHMDDGKTVRQIPLLGVRPVAKDGDGDKTSKSEGTWKVHIKTSDIEDAGCVAKATITVCGDQNSSDPVPLVCEGFVKNSEEKFEIVLGDIGEITKIRLEHDNTGDSPDWLVEQVKLVHVDSKDELVFLLNTWLAADRGEEYTTLKEVPVLRAGIDPAPVVKYTIQTTTSDTDVGTTAKDVYVTLYGENGDTGKRLLQKSDQKTKFKKGQVDTFSFDAVSVGKLKRVLFTTYSEDPQKAWFLERLSVREGAKPLKEVVFSTGEQLIQEDGPNKSIEKSLEDAVEQDVARDNQESQEKDDGQSGSKGKWTVWVTTGKDDSMGTNADLTMDVYGEKGHSESLSLVHDSSKSQEEKGSKKDKKNDKVKDEDQGESKKTDMKFAPGSVEQFEVDVGEIGALYKIRLTLDGNDDETKPAMFIEKVKMKDQDTNQEFHFLANRWLRLPEDDQAEDDKKGGSENDKKEDRNKKDTMDEKKDDIGSGSELEPESLVMELPAIRPDIPPPKVLKYELAVHFGDRGSAETEAEMYLTLFGEKGDTGKRVLLKPNTDEDDEFAKEKGDIYIFELVDLQKLQRIVVGHAAEGYGAGCFLEMITVKESAEATTQYVFSCHRWLDSEMEDCKLERELQLLGMMPCESVQQTVTHSDKPLTKGHWSVFVKTGDQPDAGTKGRVWIKVFAERGKKAGVLKSDECDGFEAGKGMDFVLNVGHIGAINKIQMELEESEDAPTWYIEKVRMKDVNTAEELEFKFDQWLGKDGVINCELPAIREGDDPVKGVQYQLRLHTGDKENSNTDSEIYVTLKGDKGNSTRQLLRKSDKEMMFQKGQVDLFTIKALDLGTVHSIQIKNSSQDSKQAWFLEKATVKPIHPEKESGEKDKEGDKKDATVEDAKGEGAEQEDKELEYLCQKWIGVADPETDELKDATSETTLYVLQENFKCKVTTSDLPDCGTDSKVTLTIGGDLGRSEVITLDNGQADNFQLDKTADFDLQPWPYVGNINKLRVELDDEAPEKSWHLKQIILENGNTGDSYSFDFNCWLSHSKEDSKDIVAELPALVPKLLPMIKYQLLVFTSKSDTSATDAPVYITIYGDQGDTGKRKLGKNDDGNTPFDKPKMDVFTLDAVSVGQVTKVGIHRGAGHKWLLDGITLKQQFASKEMNFNYQDWVEDKAKPEAACYIEIPVTETRHSAATEPQPKRETQGRWEVFITTGSMDTADTDAPVKLTVFGSKAESDVMVLGEDVPEKFRTGMTNRFEVSLGDIGRIEKIQLEQDSSNVDDWFIDTVRMTNMDTQATFGYKPRCWLDWNKGPRQEYRDIAIEIPAIWPDDDKKVLKYKISIKTSVEDNAETTGNAYMSIYGKNGHTGVRHLRKSDQDVLFQKGQTDLFTLEAVDLGVLQKIIVGHDGKDTASAWLIQEVAIQPVTEDDGKDVVSYIFKCNKWLSVDAEDKLTEREFTVSAPDDNWKAFVTTKSDDKADTKAQVMMTVYGDSGQSDELPLGDTGQGHFEAGKTDEFSLHLGNLGKLYKIRLSHDNSGEDPSWYPEKVVLEEIESRKQVTFPCDKWLSRGEDDGEIVREFAAVHDGEEPLPTLKYQVQITTGDDPAAGTKSNVYLTLYGERGDTGKRQMRLQGQDKVIFDKDTTQTFTVEAVSLGAISRCIAGHDDEAPGAGMYLKRITVKESAEAQSEDVFIADRWLDADMEDNKIEVVLQVNKES